MQLKGYVGTTAFMGEPLKSFQLGRAWLEMHFRKIALLYWDGLKEGPRESGETKVMGLLLE